MEIFLGLFAQVIAEFHLSPHHCYGQVVTQDAAPPVLEQDEAPWGPGPEPYAVSVHPLGCSSEKCQSIGVLIM